jgi:organic radical activating enzyme
MATINYTEKFLSTQGEGVFTGVTSIFLRTFGCNFKCNSFGCSTPNVGYNPDVVKVIEKIDDYKTFNELPLVKTGCDSYSSVYPEFKRFSNKVTTSELAESFLDLLPERSWIHPVTGNDVHLVVTGGEPLLGWQRAYPELLKHGHMYNLRNITFETNGTQSLQPEFVEYMKFWGNHQSRKVTFSVSAKLSASGEKWEDAIKPEVVTSYQEIGQAFLKFVVMSPAGFDEVDRAVKAYRDAGFTGLVYIMPVGGTVEEYHANMTPIADECLKRGYNFSPRLHCSLWGNSWAK